MAGVHGRSLGAGKGWLNGVDLDNGAAWELAGRGSARKHRVNARRVGWAGIMHHSERGGERAVSMR